MPCKKAMAATARIFGELEEEVDKNREGTLYANPDVSDARFTDMFEGEELKNTPYIDLAKVQMFFFTLVIALSYAVALYKEIPNAALVSEGLSFPKVHEGMLALLGIHEVASYGRDSDLHRLRTVCLEPSDQGMPRAECV